MTLKDLIVRNCKLYFKDKGLFFSSLIAPIILFFLFVAFLGGVYKDSLLSVFEGVEIESRLVNGFAGGWLMSSLLAVSAVSIAFTANCVMVQDKMTDRYADFCVSPVKHYQLALGYYIATALVTLLVCSVALVVGYIYLAIVGWYLTFTDVVLTILDTVLLVLFGTSLSSIVCKFLKSQGGITAVEVIVSAAYGFLCGAYMPIASLADAIGKTLSFLPGTYGTSLLHEHFMGGAIDEICSGLAGGDVYAQRTREGFDCVISFFDNAVPEWACYLIISITVVLLIGLYILLVASPWKKRSKKVHSS
ncbi:MAG: ABC transporter permease [Clostridia bacterium]|nr:ABC transporter permease [Clostridia bacterium]